jgi:hypothetical protein
VLAGQRERRHDIRDAGTARDQRRPSVDAGVEATPGVVVPGVAVPEQFAAESFYFGEIKYLGHRATPDANCRPGRRRSR